MKPYTLPMIDVPSYYFSICKAVLHWY